VCWVGAKPFTSLPSYMRLIDVGLLPYTRSAFNQSSFPLKVLEYLAAGRSAVCSDLPAVRTLGPLVTIASTPEGFAAAVTEELSRPRDAVVVAERRAAAQARS
jgi:teichuronic acid biosynthesis glycosyltransferase TuaH